MSTTNYITNGVSNHLTVIHRPLSNQLYLCRLNTHGTERRRLGGAGSERFAVEAFEVGGGDGAGVEGGGPLARGFFGQERDLGRIHAGGRERLGDLGQAQPALEPVGQHRSRRLGRNVGAGPAGGGG